MAAAYPPWLILEHDCTLEVQGFLADRNTLARCRTSTGHPIDVSFCAAAPPEGSRVCVQLPDGIVAPYAVVVAAHGDSVVVQVGRIQDLRRNPCLLRNNDSTDNFVYSAGDAAAEPPRQPSLSLLPPQSITDEERRPGCHVNSTGLLRRGDGDFLVAELKMQYVKGWYYDKLHREAALHLLRSGSGEWRVKRPVISRYADAGDQCVDDLMMFSWENNLVIPVGDQLLCWVDLQRGLLISDQDMFDESPSLRYPEEAYFGQRRSVCATADGSTIKVINVFPRCCCCCDGGDSKSKCRASHHAYAIHTWTLRMVDMAWVMDDSLDATQLWALDGYRGLPRVKLDSPVVSMDVPDAIYFVVCENHHKKYGDKTIWRIMVDMKSKTLRSVFRYPQGRRLRSSCWDRYLPSRVSKYFNSKPSISLPPVGLAGQAEAMQNLMSPRIMNKLEAIDDTTQTASPEAAILAAHQEIPSDLDRDDTMKAYRILTHIGLPKDLRKDLCADGDQSH